MRDHNTVCLYNVCTKTVLNPDFQQRDDQNGRKIIERSKRNIFNSDNPDAKMPSTE